MRAPVLDAAVGLQGMEVGAVCVMVAFVQICAASSQKQVSASNAEHRLLLETVVHRAHGAELVRNQYVTRCRLSRMQGAATDSTVRLAFMEAEGSQLQHPHHGSGTRPRCTATRDTLLRQRPASDHRPHKMQSFLQSNKTLCQSLLWLRAQQSVAHLIMTTWSWTGMAAALAAALATAATSSRLHKVVLLQRKTTVAGVWLLNQARRLLPVSRRMLFCGGTPERLSPVHSILTLRWSSLQKSRSPPAGTLKRADYLSQLPFNEFDTQEHSVHPHNNDTYMPITSSRDSEALVRCRALNGQGAMACACRRRNRDHRQPRPPDQTNQNAALLPWHKVTYDMSFWSEGPKGPCRWGEYSNQHAATEGSNRPATSSLNTSAHQRRCV